MPDFAELNEFLAHHSWLGASVAVPFFFVAWSLLGVRDMVRRARRIWEKDERCP